MRLAGVPHFRKLYGRIRTHNLKKGDVIRFRIVNNFEVASFKGRKGLALATENFIGGRNFGIEFYSSLEVFFLSSLLLELAL